MASVCKYDQTYLGKIDENIAYCKEQQKASGFRKISYTHLPQSIFNLSWRATILPRNLGEKLVDGSAIGVIVVSIAIKIVLAHNHQLYDRGI